MEGKTERIQKNIIYALEIATAVASLYLVLRVMVGPDAVTRIRMGSARAVSRVAKRQADVWTEIAGKADTAYWQARNTVL